VLVPGVVQPLLIRPKKERSEVLIDKEEEEKREMRVAPCGA